MQNSHTNSNNYADGRNGMFMQAPAQDFYESLNSSTSAPGRAVMVLNPNDPPYKVAISAFNNQHLLNPNQNTQESLSRAYYTINSAYGSTPVATQISRTCTGSVRNY